MEQGHAGDGDRKPLAEMRATGMANGIHHGANGRQGSAIPSPLRGAASNWLRRGYRIDYDDEHLVQLVAPFRALSPRDLLLSSLVGVGLGVLGACGTLGYLWLTRHGRRHIVSLVLTPERRVVTHEQWQAPAKERRS